VVAALVAGKAPDADAIKALVKSKLAGYKMPRHVMVAESVERAATGKADYKAVRERILAWLGTKG
jgi:fatty-acyl-CoA synthase